VHSLRRHGILGEAAEPIHPQHGFPFNKYSKDLVRASSLWLPLEPSYKLGCHFSHAGFLHGPVFSSEDGSEIFLLNIS
jgi:hypothetical protein